MTSRPDWLPSMLSLSGTWEEILSELYALFDKDFKQSKLNFKDHIVWWNRRILPGERYEEGFWHLITREDRSTGERLPDFRRAERLPWCGPIITHSDDTAAKVWDYREGTGQLRTYIWLEDWDYCVILEKVARGKKKVALLITAFYVDGPLRRRSLRRKFAKRET